MTFTGTVSIATGNSSTNGCRVHLYLIHVELAHNKVWTLDRNKLWESVGLVPCTSWTAKSLVPSNVKGHGKVQY